MLIVGHLEKAYKHKQTKKQLKKSLLEKHRKKGIRSQEIQAASRNWKGAGL